MDLSDEENTSGAALRHRAEKRLSATTLPVNDLTTAWFIPPIYDLNDYPGLFVSVSAPKVYDNTCQILSHREHIDYPSTQLMTQSELIREYGVPLGMTQTAFRLLSARKVSFQVDYRQVFYSNLSTHTVAYRVFLNQPELAVLRCPRLEERLLSMVFTICDHVDPETAKKLKCDCTRKQIEFEFSTSPKNTKHVMSVSKAQSLLRQMSNKFGKPSEEGM